MSALNKISKLITNPKSEAYRYYVRKKSLKLLESESTEVSYYPPRVTIELTNICNLRCPICPTGNGSQSRSSGKITLENFKKLVDEIALGTTSLGLHSYGESIMHKHFNEMVAYARNKGLTTYVDANLNHITTFERAQKLMDSGIDELKISLDGVDQESYERYRVRGNFARVIQAIKWLVEIRDSDPKCHTKIKLQYLVMNHNEEYIERFLDLGDELRVDGVMVDGIWIDMLHPDAQSFREYLPKGEKYLWYDVSDENVIKLKDTSGKFCTKPLEQMLIFWDGTVGFCCLDVQSKITFGNALEDGVLNIWNGDKMQQARDLLKNKPGALLPCSNCPGSKN